MRRSGSDGRAETNVCEETNRREQSADATPEGKKAEGGLAQGCGGVPALTVRALESTGTALLELRCSNADPNYGALWFQCRGRPSDSAKWVLRRAQRWMSAELAALAPLYYGALCRRLLVEHALNSIATAAAALAADEAKEGGDGRGNEEEVVGKGAGGAGDEADLRALELLDRAGSLLGPALKGRRWEDAVEAALRRACPIDPAPLFAPATAHGSAPGSAPGSGAADDGAVSGEEAPHLVGCPVRAEDLATGLVGLNRLGAAGLMALPDDHRRKVLFGCDQIVP